MARLPRECMQQHVRKKDAAKVGLHAIDEVIAKKTSDPTWMGEDSTGGGRPRALSESEANELVQLVFRERGKARVTIAYSKRRLKFLRRLNNTTIARYLHEAGLQWLTRRAKSWVPGAHKEQRLTYAGNVVKKHQATLARQAYTDGTSFYLARCAAEHGDKQRAALGRFVWRRANGSDGLFDSNVGPSLYAKASPPHRPRI